MSFQARFTPSDETTETQRNTISEHDGEFDTVEEAAEFAVVCDTNIALYDAAGFQRGWVKRDGTWSLS